VEVEAQKEKDKVTGSCGLADDFMTAFFMSQHPRLGAQCKIPLLEERLMRICLCQDGEDETQPQIKNAAPDSHLGIKQSTVNRILKDLMPKNRNALSSKQDKSMETTVVDVLVETTSPDACKRALKRLTQENIAKAFKTYHLYFDVQVLIPATKQSDFALESVPPLLLHPLSANAAAIVMQAMCRRLMDRFIRFHQNAYIQECFKRENESRDLVEQSAHAKSLIYCGVSKAVLTVEEHQKRIYSTHVEADKMPAAVVVEAGSEREMASRHRLDGSQHRKFIQSDLMSTHASNQDEFSASALEARLFSPRNMDHMKSLAGATGLANPGQPSPAFRKLILSSNGQTQNPALTTTAKGRQLSNLHQLLPTLRLQGSFVKQDFREPTPRLTNGVQQLKQARVRTEAKLQLER